MNKLSQKTDCLADLLAAWMAKRGADHFDAGEILGVSHQTVRNWLDGALPPSTRVPSLARALGVPERRLREVIDHDRAPRSTSTKAKP